MFGGLANYIRAVQDGDFLNGLKNMFVFGVVQVPVMLGLAILLALLLAESRGVFMKVCRTTFFMPYGIPSAIGALIWGYLVLAELVARLTRSWPRSTRARSNSCRQRRCFFRSPTS